jgi:hypothetical protein
MPMLRRVRACLIVKKPHVGAMSPMATTFLMRETRVMPQRFAYMRQVRFLTLACVVQVILLYEILASGGVGSTGVQP